MLTLLLMMRHLPDVGGRASVTGEVTNWTITPKEQ